MSGFYNAQCCGIAFEYQTYNSGPSYRPGDIGFFLSCRSRSRVSGILTLQRALSGRAALMPGTPSLRAGTDYHEDTKKKTKSTKGYCTELFRDLRVPLDFVKSRGGPNEPHARPDPRHWRRGIRRKPLIERLLAGGTDIVAWHRPDAPCRSCPSAYGGKRWTCSIERPQRTNFARSAGTVYHCAASDMLDVPGTTRRPHS